LGKAPFRHLEVIVRQGVLIPRPETEVLVDKVILELKEREILDTARVIDLCTGTGCIALSLLKECPELRLVATDIDPLAVALALENARAFGLDGSDQLQILEDDLASSLISIPSMCNSFDVVVSNPPYVPTEELVNLPNEIAKYEPLMALDGGANGLEVFARIVNQAKSLLKPSGLLACELHETKLDEAREICLNEGYTDVSLHNDLADRPRIITAHTAP
jgi:release factor-specific protein-(glutamine-N5) methyltransferase